jgi:hypothetical protein
MCQLSWNLGTSTSWKPQGLSRPVMELLYFLLVLSKFTTSKFYCSLKFNKPIPLAAWCKPWVCGSSVAGIAGSNPTGDIDVFLLWVLVFQIEDASTGWSLVQRSPKECHVSEWDGKVSLMRRSCSSRVLIYKSDLIHGAQSLFENTKFSSVFLEILPLFYENRRFITVSIKAPNLTES